MQHLPDLQEKIFFEAKIILESLSKITSRDELLAKQDLFTEVTDRIAFLRILEKNEEAFSTSVLENTPPLLETEFDNSMSKTLEKEVAGEEPIKQQIEEEVIFTNDLNDFHTTDEENQIELFNDEVPADEAVRDNQDYTFSAAENDLSHEAVLAQKERELEELEERRRKIVEFTRHPEQETMDSPPVTDPLPTALQQAEKKFKLAHIKGLKVVQQIFDNDPIENEEEEKQENLQPDSGSLMKSNVKTDFMEAERRKPEFRLDLNDKVAFTKSLFNGNEHELKETIDHLNSFTNLEDAKQFLSEVYYKKNWNQKDEYAQRLWNLVENKFL